MADSKPRISVVVPCFNYGHLLAETLSNLQSQSFENWECIIVDDGSTDNTSEVATKFVNKDSRYIYFHQKNSGLSAARNSGIKNAQGEFIQLLDADDLISSDKFKLQLAVFDQFEKLDLVYSEVRYFHSESPGILRYTMEGEDKPWMLGKDSSNQQELKESLIRINIGAVNGPLIRKTVFNKVGFFNVKLKSVEDWEFWCRCAYENIQFKFYPHEGAYAIVRLHSNSMSRSKKGMMEAASIVRITLDTLIRKDIRFENKDYWLKINTDELAFLHKQLFGLYKNERDKPNASRHLLSFSKIKNDYRFFVKERLKLIFY
jgi:glycosyltransferase involved in cell wall biosynthesis